eukprot:scaffold3900_cov258-Pinguiococcus_pyrenoidosus.AAC.8
MKVTDEFLYSIGFVFGTGTCSQHEVGHRLRRSATGFRGRPQASTSGHEDTFPGSSDAVFKSVPSHLKMPRRHHLQTDALPGLACHS